MREFNFGNRFALRYFESEDGTFYQAYTSKEFDEMQAMIDDAFADVVDIQTLEVENNLLRARNERLQKLIDSVVPRLEAACGATAMPPLVIRKLIEESK
jgi:hypothetical protein